MVISVLQAKLTRPNKRKHISGSKLAEYERRNKVGNLTYTTQKASQVHRLSNRFDDSQANAMDWLQDEIKDAVYKLRSGDLQVKEIIWIVFGLGHAPSFEIMMMSYSCVGKIWQMHLNTDSLPSRRQENQIGFCLY